VRGTNYEARHVQCVHVTTKWRVMRETRLHFINDRGQPTRGSHLAYRLDKGRTTPLRKTKNQHVTKGHTGPRTGPDFSNCVHTDVLARAGRWRCATRDQVTLPEFQNTNLLRCVGNQSPVQPGAHVFPFIFTLC